MDNELCKGIKCLKEDIEITSNGLRFFSFQSSTLQMKICKILLITFCKHYLNHKDLKTKLFSPYKCIWTYEDASGFLLDVRNEILNQKSSFT